MDDQEVDGLDGLNLESNSIHSNSSAGIQNVLSDNSDAEEEEQSVEMFDVDEEIEIKVDAEEMLSQHDSTSEPEGRKLRDRRKQTNNPDFIYYDGPSSSNNDPVIIIKSEPEDSDFESTKQVSSRPVRAKRKVGPASRTLRPKVRSARADEGDYSHLLGSRIMELVIEKLPEIDYSKGAVLVSENLTGHSFVTSIPKSKQKILPSRPPVAAVKSPPKKPEERSFIEPRIEFPEFDTDDSEENILLEVCVDNYLSIMNAVRGGAGRIELCSALSEGGLTPTPGLLRMAKANARIPIFVMIRPRGGDFVYSPQEIEIMTMDIVHYKETGADGFVFGVLDKNGSIDEAKCKILMKAADPLPCTFHRAFDLVSHPLRALESVMKLGFSRILTSGQQPSAEQGIPFIRQLVRTAGNYISIMAGAGVNPGNVAKIVRETGVQEVHGSARIKIDSQMKRKKNDGVSMGTPGTDDSCHYATDFKIVTEIVKNAASVFEA